MDELPLLDCNSIACVLSLEVLPKPYGEASARVESVTLRNPSQYVQVLMPAADLKQLQGFQPLATAQQHSTDVVQFSQPAQQLSGANRPGAYGITNHGMQSYLPIAEKHDLAPEDRADVKQGLKQWWPKIGAGYSTPMSQLLASPAKSAIILGGLLGSFGALLGLGAGGLGIVLAGGLCGLLGGFAGYISRRQENENILDLMHRLPPNATKRDMLSDPVYQKDLDRRAMAQTSGSGDLLTGLMLASTMNTRRYGSQPYTRPATMRRY